MIMQTWPHAPTHRFNQKGSYIVTGSTLHKELFFKKESELELLQNLLIELANHYNWCLEAWAIFPNHYHFVAQSPAEPATLKKFITHFHANSARTLNTLHNTPGRRVWFQFWDTNLTYHNSYLARLNYVMQNPVKHGIVDKAVDYKWCSAAWFENNTDNAYVKTVKSFKIDSVIIKDDF